MNIFEHLSNTIAQLFHETTKFTTSADVVMKASGLRLEAVCAIAREQGVEIEDTACRCIDESLLASLADAHIRRLKAYFHNAKRHIAELAGDEFATFVEFCETYQKRPNLDLSSLLWSDIDTKAIREQFLNKVHKFTPPEKYHSCFSGLSFDETVLESHRLEYIDVCNPFEGVVQEGIIDKVIQSFLYYEKPCRIINFILDLRSEARKTILSARYHIFASEDDGHHNDVVSNFHLLINAPKMVV
jgi:hypothetical protein